VQNEAIQSWLLGLFSKRAITKERGENESKYSATLKRFEDALRLMCRQDVTFGVDIEPSLQPRLCMYGRRLDFSQLPDGVRSTVGWLADFLMRMDMVNSQPEAIPSGVLLLDEVDAHLHPKWQRSILPSIKEALPEVQVFATSHSPFVIASCPGARIHVLDLDESGRATNRPPEDAPIGESLLATMKDIFGVNSRFDIDTENLLEEWNRLRRSQAAGTISTRGARRMEELRQILSSRSEELRQIVSPAVPLGESFIASLQSQADSLGRGQEPKQASKRR
jgi:predicted ATP-binding protein involved in virulence